MTRARDDLVLVQPLRFFIRGQSRGGDDHVFAPRSRFIADEDLDAFELVGSPNPSLVHTATPVTQSAVSVDLKATIRAMWR